MITERNVTSVTYEDNKAILELNHDRISSIEYQYIGEEKDAELFLKTIIMDYLRDHKMID